MDLKEAKQKIRLIPTKGAEENTAKCQGWIQMDDDCFGIGLELTP